MSFRSRLLIAFAVATSIPLTLLAFGVRRQLTARLVSQHERRVAGLARVARQDLERESASIAARLSSVAGSLPTDDRFRLTIVRGSSGDRTYVLDWAAQAMQPTGLSMLQLQDEQGRILSSGHFRNEFDRLEPALPRALLAATSDEPMDRPPGGVLVRARAPDGPFLALARTTSVHIADRRFDLVGGVRVDSAFLSRFAREEGLAITLVTPAETLRVSAAGAGAAVGSPGDDALATSRKSARERGDTVRGSVGDPDVVAELPIAYATGDSASLARARLRIEYTIPELTTLRRDVDRWFIATLALVIASALGFAAWLSARMSAPLAALTSAAARIELEGPELAIAAGRDDEIGTLARRLGSLSTRLRASAARLRQAERRATIGDMARQVNHDIKNGLIPIRNVLRHLVQVQEQEPQQLASVFAERRSTLESSVGYLDTLARNYARLMPNVERRAVDVNGIIRELAASAATPGDVAVRTRLADGLPRAFGDPVVVRRIVDNLVRNAAESLDARGGDVSITTSRTREGAVRIVVADTGRGMSEQELAHAFDDFYSTKPDGTGLGLSVVRRLTADLHGSLRVESEPGRGTTFTIELPACTPS